MDLSQAIHAHAEWKTKLRGAIAQQQELDAAAAAADNVCALGKWLHGDGRAQLGRLPSYAECVRNHAAFHKAAARVVEAINAKRYAEAETMLSAGSAYANASTAVGVTIKHLQKELGA